MVDAPLDCHLTRLSATYKALVLQPPEIITAFYVARNDKDSDRNLQLSCKSKGMRVVIAVSIIKGQYHRYAPVTHPLPLLQRRIELFQRLFEMQQAIVLTQVEHLTAQISSNRAMVFEDNHAPPQAACPPVCKFYQPTIVET